MSLDGWFSLAAELARAEAALIGYVIRHRRTGRYLDRAAGAWDWISPNATYATVVNARDAETLLAQFPEGDRIVDPWHRAPQREA